MLVNKPKEVSTSRVKFISYTGKYPCLCSGVLTLEIDGKKYKFGHDFFTKEEESDKPNFDSFWSSGGSVTHDDDWNFDVDSGEWEIDVEEIPEQFRELAAEIDEVFNENVPYGCCGGCI